MTNVCNSSKAYRYNHVFVGRGIIYWEVVRQRMQLSDSIMLLWSAHWITRGTCNPSAGNAHPVCLLTYRIMSGSGYTVEVTNLSSSASENDLHEFFSFSGPIEHIDLIRWCLLVIHKLQLTIYDVKTCWASFKIHHAYWTFDRGQFYVFYSFSISNCHLIGQFKISCYFHVLFFLSFIFWQI